MAVKVSVRKCSVALATSHSSAVAFVSAETLNVDYLQIDDAQMTVALTLAGVQIQDSHDTGSLYRELLLMEGSTLIDIHYSTMADLEPPFTSAVVLKTGLSGMFIFLLTQSLLPPPLQTFKHEPLPS